MHGLFLKYSCKTQRVNQRKSPELDQDSVHLSILISHNQYHLGHNSIIFNGKYIFFQFVCLIGKYLPHREH